MLRSGPVSRGLATSQSDERDASATDWVPPQHALAGDKGQSYLYTHIEEKKELNDASSIPSATTETSLTEQPDVTVDWLQTRRAVRSDNPSSVQPSLPLAASGHLMKPLDAQRAKQALVDDIAVHEHMLLTRTEITRVLLAMGGLDIQVVIDTKGLRNGGSGSGTTTGIVLATGTSHAHLKTLAETLIRQLRRRKLHEVGVVGATMGADGNWNDVQERWFVVDCHNYVVHLQDAKTRKAIDLEALWSGQDGLYKVNLDDDTAVEDYVAAHPVPADYHGGMASSWQGHTATAKMDWDDTLKQLAKSRWTTAPPAQSRRPSRPMAAPKRLRKTSGRKT